MTGLDGVPIGSCVQSVATWNPLRCPTDKKFIYIDLSAVDQELKQIVGAREMCCGDAPSRARQLVEAGDVLVSTVRPNLNGVAFVPSVAQGATASTGFCVLRPNREMLDGRYLFHWVRSPMFVDDMVQKATGASYPAISDRTVRDSRLPLPPLSEQRRIAAILDRVDVLRAKRRQVSTELDGLTQSIFLDMFGDPTENDRGWTLGRVSDFVASFESGKSLVANDEDDQHSKFRVLKISAVTSLEFLPEESKALPFGYQPPSSHIVRSGDLLFSRANTASLIGATAFVPQVPSNLVLPDKLWRFVWHSTPKALPLYVRQLFQQPKFRREIARRATGTSGSMKNISQDKVMSIQVGLPPVQLQQNFTTRIQIIESIKSSHRAAQAYLDGLFVSLQQRAFRGEL